MCGKGKLRHNITKRHSGGQSDQLEPAQALRHAEGLALPTEPSLQPSPAAFYLHAQVWAVCLDSGLTTQHGQVATTVASLLKTPQPAAAPPTQWVLCVQERLIWRLPLDWSLFPVCPCDGRHSIKLLSLERKRVAVFKNTEDRVGMVMMMMVKMKMRRRMEREARSCPAALLFLV